MTKRIRRLIFYLLLAAFIILVPIIILYALGYTFDFEKKVIIPTGGIYLRSQPQKAEIYINDKLRGKTNKLVKRLVPKNYQIEVIKEDYYPWQKELTAKSGLVTKANDILLIPFNPKISLTTKDQVKNFSLSPDQKKMLYLASNSLQLIDISQNQNTELFNYYWPIKDFIWSSDNETVITLSENGNYHFFNINDLEIFNLNDLIRTKSKYTISKTEIENVNFGPDDKKIYFISKNNLYAFELNEDVKRSTLSDILVPNALNYVIYKKGIVYLESVSGQIFELDLTSLISAEFFNQVFPSINQCDWILSNSHKKLLCKKDESVEILWLEAATNDSIIREKGDIEKIDFNQKINNIIWHPKTDEHLIVSTNDSILITELDNRVPRNTITFTTTPNPKIQYSPKTETLYFLSQDRLYQTEL